MPRASALNLTRWLHLAVLVAGLAYAAFAHAEVQLGQLRLSAGEESTRAELQLDAAPGDYRLFSLANPDRLVLDLPGAALADGFRPPAPNGRVIGVRTGSPEAGKLRIVFDLAGAVRPRTRVEGTGRASRLVLEMFRDEAAMAANTPSAVAPATNAPATSAAAAPSPVSGARELLIAIDAGHGGRDPGAIGGGGTYEKTVTLKVARAMAEEIDRHPGMRALLIRDGDVFIPLGDRYQKARDAQADLFISVHADAAQSRQANGASVFVLSTRGASSEAARFLADRENNADLVGGVSLEDKDRSLAAVLLDLSQSATMRVSDEAANHVLDELRSVGKTHKPQVERANFWVLRSPDVPSMLVETGFITNAADERKLNDAGFRRRLAEVVARGVSDYFGSQPPPGTWFAANPSRGSRQHVVARGETLGLIAARHGISLSQLRNANDKRDDVVRVGERLRIPAAPE
ncbi:N-acetylmuramoyl-L-alanine amidase [Silanimonas sp.]|jgi:N-acetylmuramoyl-L-alanine amidase|uniref:N-acetylmuramoyl-L-alanine amidase n=1 Tax=Silanimonas sp. TaxID=1929290 RepID=UPI0037C557BA